MQRAEKTASRSRDPDLLAVLHEVRAWLEDPHQWSSASPSNWSSLLDDVGLARAASTGRLRGHLERSAGNAFEEIKSIRGAIRGGDSLDLSLRRRLDRAVDAIRDGFLDKDALREAWRDLVDTGDPLEAIDAARGLFSVAAEHGHNPGTLSNYLNAILNDDYHAILSARDEEPGENPPERAGASIEERLALAADAVTELPREGDVVIWLLFAFATRRGSLSPLMLGDRVTLYDISWLRSVSTGSALFAHPLPPELEADAKTISLLLRPESESNTEQAVPRLAIRIDLGRILIAEAEESARRSAEALVALAALQAEETPWVLEESFLMYVNGELGPWRFASPAAFTLEGERRIAVEQDITASVIERNAEHWAPHFPIRDPRMQEAAHLLVWLRRTRETWTAGRLLLCDRVIERAAGWAGLADVARFVAEYLKVPWAINQIRNEIVSCGWSAFNALGEMEGASRAEWERAKRWHDEIHADPEIGFDIGPEFWSLRPDGILRRLEWIIERVPGETFAHSRVRRLQDRVRDGRAAAGWADELMGEFDARNARSRRLRNALTHGGPASAETAALCVPFVETLAIQALHTAVQGRLEGTDLVDHFLDDRAKSTAILARLHDGANPADALWESRAGEGM